MHGKVFGLVVAFTVLLMLPSSIDFAWQLSPAETSFRETYIVPAGRSVAASGGRLGLPELHVSGSLNVQSCCGFSTNDIMFGISNQNGGSRNFGLVVRDFSFTWDTGTNEEYSLVFTNQFNQSSSSYHDKTVEINVTEVGPPGSINFVTLFTIIAIGAISIVSLSAAFILVLHHRKRTRAQQGKPSTQVLHQLMFREARAT